MHALSVPSFWSEWRPEVDRLNAKRVAATVPVRVPLTKTNFGAPNGLMLSRGAAPPPSSATRSVAQNERRKPRANERRYVGSCNELGVTFRERMQLLPEPVIRRRHLTSRSRIDRSWPTPQV